MDDLPDMLAQLDQLRKGLTDFAPVLGAYRDALMEAGFERPEAVRLCVEYQSKLFFQAGEAE